MRKNTQIEREHCKNGLTSLVFVRERQSEAEREEREKGRVKEKE